MAVTESTKTRFSKPPEYLHAAKAFAYVCLMWLQTEDCGSSTTLIAALETLLMKTTVEQSRQPSNTEATVQLLRNGSVEDSVTLPHLV